MQNPSEQRRRERKEVDQTIAVKDALLNADVGQVVNIHEEGFMLIGSGQIRENCLYQFSICLSEAVQKKSKISVGAECLWLKETDSGTQYWAGFHIIDISESDRDIITELVQ